jgi:molybdate transport system substrate-binding protein
MLDAGMAKADEQPPVTVFAAASMTDALEQLAQDYRRVSADRMRFSFASSSTLARQIEAGAPADIFISANEQWMGYLARKALIEPATQRSPVGNTLTIIAPAGSAISSIQIEPGFNIAGLIGAGERIAAGDPEHVPAGIYAKEALETLGVWSVAEPLLARADSVRAALALVERGEAPLGITYATDALASRAVKVVATFPPQSHKPITYPFAIVAGRSTAQVRRFFDYVTTGTAAPVYRSFGFSWIGPTG